jgi:hypothetical protein
MAKWNQNQICSWIGNQMMDLPDSFERKDFCAFVRFLGSDERLRANFPDSNNFKEWLESPFTKATREANDYEGLKPISDNALHDLINLERAKVFHDEQRVAYRVARALESIYGIR